MATINLEASLGIAPDALWKSVGDFGGVSDWLPVVTQSELVGESGNQRTCVLANGGELAETLTSFDDASRKLVYTVTEGLPFSHHSASMEVADGGDGRSTFRWITDYTLAEGAPEGFADMFEGMLRGEVGQLEQRWP